MGFKIKVALLLSTVFVFTSSAFALENIIRPYQSVRSAGMGGLILTTGLYEENFFNNPARISANPESKLTIIQITPLEVTPTTVSQGFSIIGGADPITTVSNNAGQNLHDRFQLIFPAYYRAATGDRKLSFAVALIASIQADANLTQSYQAAVGGISDIGPAITVGHKFLENDALSVGLTTHLIYRLAMAPSYSILDYVRGTPLSINNYGGDGAMIDFDIGSTYKLTKLGEFNIDVAFAMQNLLGGSYSNLGLRPLNLSGTVIPQPRSFGIGGSATRGEWGNFKDTVFALEIKDILNNANGSLFRLLHLGGETHWRSLALRLGLNQGYWTAGLGVDVRWFNVDLASYGEEMGLNIGTKEDRRYTLSLAFHVH